MKFNILFIAILSIFIYGCDKKDQNTQKQAEVEINGQQTSKQQEINDINAPFKLTMLNGNTLTMQKDKDGFKFDNNGKATLLVFFATWCPPCKAEIPHLIDLQSKFNSKLQIIGVLMEDKDKSSVQDFANQYKINYDISIGENNFLLSKIIGNVTGIPYMILYYPNGKYATRYLGLVPEEMLQSDITKVVF